MLLTVNKLNEVLTGVLGSQKYSLPFNHEAYVKLLDLESEFYKAKTIDYAKALIASAQEVVANALQVKELETYGESLKYDKASQKFFLHQNGITSSIALPRVLGDKIVESMDKKLPITPIVKAWTWLLRNPKFSLDKAERFGKYITTTNVDREMRKQFVEQGYSDATATELATFNDVAITRNGLLSTYKYVRIKYNTFDGETGEQKQRYSKSFDTETGHATINLPDNAEDYYLIPAIVGESYDPFYAGASLGHKVTVGDVHYLPEWSQVDCTDGTTARPGLHLGGLKYIQHFGGNDRLLLNCFVNPMHIGAFTDSGDGAIRVKEYFVHSAQFAPNKQLYHESDYLARSNDQWAALRAEAIADSEKKIAQIKQLQNELNAL